MILKVVFAAIASMAFGLTFNIRGRNILFAGLCGGLGYLVFLLVMEVEGPVAALVASVVITLYSEIAARLLKAPASNFLVTGLIPLVPGTAMFNSILKLVQNQTENAVAYGLEALMRAAAIAVGIIVVSALVKLVFSHQRTRC